MKTYIKPEIEVIGVQPEGLLATSFGADYEILGPLGVSPRGAYASDDDWGFE